jgi:hypothetical protein
MSRTQTVDLPQDQTCLSVHSFLAVIVTELCGSARECSKLALGPLVRSLVSGLLFLGLKTAKAKHSSSWQLRWALKVRVY